MKWCNLTLYIIEDLLSYELITMYFNYRKYAWSIIPFFVFFPRNQEKSSGFQDLAPSFATPDEPSTKHRQTWRHIESRKIMKQVLLVEEKEENIIPIHPIHIMARTLSTIQGHVDEAAQLIWIAQATLLQLVLETISTTMYLRQHHPFRALNLLLRQLQIQWASYQMLLKLM